MHLILGILWLTAGLVLIGWEWYTGSTRLLIRGTEISASWMLPLLAIYNFVRWYSARAYRTSQRELFNERAARLREVRYRDRPEQPDPNFDFTNKPPAPLPPPGNVTDRPPGSN